MRPTLLKKRLAIFPSPAGMSLTKLSLAGNIKLFPARESLVSDIPAGGRENRLPFFTVYYSIIIYDGACHVDLIMSTVKTIFV